MLPFLFCSGNQGERLEGTFCNDTFQDVCNMYQAPESRGDKAIETLFNIINKKGKQDNDESEKLELQQQEYNDLVGNAGRRRVAWRLKNPVRKTFQ